MQMAFAAGLTLYTQWLGIGSKFWQWLSSLFKKREKDICIFIATLVTDIWVRDLKTNKQVLPQVIDLSYMIS